MRILTLVCNYGGSSLVSPVVEWLWDNRGRHIPRVRANWVGFAGPTVGRAFGTTTHIFF